MLQFRNLSTGAPADRLPNIDIHEANGELILRAEVPGLHLGEVGLTLDHDALIIDADAWDDSGIGREHYEHVHGRLPLPFGASPSVVTGQVADDVLELRIPLPPLPDGEAWLPSEELAY
jgi:HSP20 family molecular chaperone IbpA